MKWAIAHFLGFPNLALSFVWTKVFGYPKRKVDVRSVDCMVPLEDAGDPTWPVGIVGRLSELIFDHERMFSPSCFWGCYDIEIFFF